MSVKPEAKNVLPHLTVGYGDGLTGPNTPRVGGVTCEEAVASDKGKDLVRHTPLSFGKDTLAIVVGEDHKKNAEIIARAVNSHEKLLEAAKDASELLDRIMGYVASPRTDEIWRNLDEAIKAAEEK